MEFEDLVDDSTFFLLGTRSGRSLSEERSEPVEPWLRQPEMGWDERPGGSCGKLLALRPPCDHSIFHHFKLTPTGDWRIQMQIAVLVGAEL